MIAHFAEPFASLANTHLRSSVVFRKESTDLELQQLKELQAVDVVLPRKKRGHKSRADRRPRASEPSVAGIEQQMRLDGANLKQARSSHVRDNDGFGHWNSGSEPIRQFRRPGENAVTKPVQKHATDASAEQKAGLLARIADAEEKADRAVKQAAQAESEAKKAEEEAQQATQRTLNQVATDHRAAVQLQKVARGSIARRSILRDAHVKQNFHGSQLHGSRGTLFEDMIQEERDSGGLKEKAGRRIEPRGKAKAAGAKATRLEPIRLGDDVSAATPAPKPKPEPLLGVIPEESKPRQTSKRTSVAKDAWVKQNYQSRDKRGTFFDEMIQEERDAGGSKEKAGRRIEPRGKAKAAGAKATRLEPGAGSTLPRSEPRATATEPPASDVFRQAAPKPQGQPAAAEQPPSALARPQHVDAVPELERTETSESRALAEAKALVKGTTGALQPGNGSGSYYSGYYEDDGEAVKGPPAPEAATSTSTIAASAPTAEEGDDGYEYYSDDIEGEGTEGVLAKSSIAASLEKPPGVASSPPKLPAAPTAPAATRLQAKEDEGLDEEDSYEYYSDEEGGEKTAEPPPPTKTPAAPPSAPKPSAVHAPAKPQDQAEYSYEGYYTDNDDEERV